MIPRTPIQRSDGRRSVQRSKMETANANIGNAVAFHPLQRSGGRGIEGVGHFMKSYPSRAKYSDMETATTDVGNDLAFHPLQRSGGRGTKGVGPYRDSEFSILSQIFSTKFKLGI